MSHHTKDFNRRAGAGDERWKVGIPARDQEIVSLLRDNDVLRYECGALRNQLELSWLVAMTSFAVSAVIVMVALLA